jgi:hypothetical protein
MDSQQNTGWALSTAPALSRQSITMCLFRTYHRIAFHLFRTPAFRLQVFVPVVVAAVNAEDQLRKKQRSRGKLTIASS